MESFARVQQLINRYGALAIDFSIEHNFHTQALPDMSDPVVIIGAGLAGLCCASHLNRAGVDTLLLEASDGVGGRVRTDQVDGFLLDRGFQVLLTAYPEAINQLNYEDLNLRRFEPGSLVKTSSGLERISDPWRQPKRALQTALADVGSVWDKIRIGSLRWTSCRGSVDSIFDRYETTTAQELQRLGFSEAMTEQFLRPFLGGVFLESELQTSSRMLHFVFRMFSQGDTALPARGMGEISKQLASQLPEQSIKLNARVESIGQQRVKLDSGTEIPFRQLVIAAEQSAAAKLVTDLVPAKTSRSVTCVYFAAPETPVADRMLVLNGTREGLVNNMCVPSQIAPEYASDGRVLISTTILKSIPDPETLHLGIKEQLKGWFGKAVDHWQHLRTYQIEDALPDQSPGALQASGRPDRLAESIFVCGDYRVNGSINGAMQSGRVTAEQLLAQR